MDIIVSFGVTTVRKLASTLSRQLFSYSPSTNNVGAGFVFDRGEDGCDLSRESKSRFSSVVMGSLNNKIREYSKSTRRRVKERERERERERGRTVKEII